MPVKKASKAVAEDSAFINKAYSMVTENGWIVAISTSIIWVSYKFYAKAKDHTLEISKLQVENRKHIREMNYKEKQLAQQAKLRRSRTANGGSE